MAQLPAQPLPWDLIVQERPVLVGSVSDSLTSLAAPVPVLNTVRVKPIGSPASTWAASAVFTIRIAGAATHVEAVEWSVPSLLVVTSPVLLITPLPSGQVPPVAAVVGEVMC